MLTVLSGNSYQATLAEIDLGQIGATKKVSILWDDGIPRTSYVKVYQPEERCRKLCNEAIGFLLADKLGLLQPQKAALMPIPEFIKSEFNTVSDIFSGNNIWAWVTTECGESLKANFRINSKSANTAQKNKFISDCINFLANKECISPIIAFDDYIANDDRNIGNLVITHTGHIGIIDHGEILGRIDWLNELPKLLEDQYFSNKLLMIINSSAASKFSIRGASVNAYHHHVSAFEQSKDTLKYWLEILLQLSNKDMDYQEYCLNHLLKYLCNRSQAPAESFAQRIGLVA